MMAWGQVGVYMPHNSEAQIAMFPRVPMNALQPGDIVWFPGHVGHLRRWRRRHQCHPYG